MDETSLTRQWYDKNAEEYTKHVRDPKSSVYHHYYEKPAMYKLLPDSMEGLKVMSLGCGSGEDCHELASRNAEVVGVDISSELIVRARETYPECTYIVADMGSVDFDPNTFDLVYSSLAIHYIDNWDKVLSMVHKVLRKNGIFQFSMNHPFASARGVLDVEIGKIKGLFRIKSEDKPATIYGDYFSYHDLKAFKTEDEGLTSYHKNFQIISYYALRNGFYIEKIIEPVPDKAMKKYDLSSYESLLKLPYFVIFRFIKIS